MDRISGMVLKSTQTSIGYSHKFCATIGLAYLTDRKDCRSKIVATKICGWDDIYIFLLVACRVSSYTKDIRTWINAPQKHQLDFSLFNELCGCCPWQLTLPSVFCLYCIFVIALLNILSNMTRTKAALPFCSTQSNMAELRSVPALRVMLTAPAPGIELEVQRVYVAIKQVITLCSQTTFKHSVSWKRQSCLGTSLKPASLYKGASQFLLLPLSQEAFS